MGHTRTIPRAVIALLALLTSLEARPQSASLREEAARSLKKAAMFFSSQVARHGGYVYYCSVDLRERWGEGKATPDQIWVQPPGTPTVGLAYLQAHAATGDPFYVDAATKAAEALVRGQLESGGWTNLIDFNPSGGRVGRYRKGGGGGWNASSLDDGQTPSALRLLIQADQALGLKHREIHEAAEYGLNALLKAQFPNGAFPQVWTAPVQARPVRKAGYPEYDWRTEGRVKNYWDMYTLNDNLAGAVSETLIDAHRAYKDERYRAALEKLGDFLILAQMPDPQPAWAQQYDYEGHPIWARKFEPPAITGWESQDVLETLLKIFRHTGQKRFLEPIPRALAYLEKSLLPDGRLARYYELKTNKPLYMTAKYELSHDDSDVPGHYGWKMPSRIAAIAKEHDDCRKGGAVRRAGRSAVELEPDVRRVLAELDGEGRWISVFSGERLVGQPKFPASFRYISSEIFSRNVATLSEYLAATK
jgi:PelA/Pel-15E family pectate lyase